MINYLKRNRVNIIVALVIAVPICILAYIEQSERTPPVVKKEPTETIVVFESQEETEPSEVIEPTEVIEPNDKVEVEEPIDTVSEADIDLLAHLLYGEVGYSYISDETIYYVGSVVLNRINSNLYPNTLYDVIYQPGQYACTWDGNIEKEPTERYYTIAEDLLKYGSILPENVLYQASFKQGSGVYEYRDNMYFCYY